MVTRCVQGRTVVPPAASQRRTSKPPGIRDMSAHAPECAPIPGTLGVMCRYGSSRYKPHYACFACRKVFRRRLRGDIGDVGPDRPFKCPQCAGEMADLGRDFAAPRQRDKRAWATVAQLYEIGETFHSCGCSGPGYRPRDPAALRVFLRERLEWYESRARERAQVLAIPPPAAGQDWRARDADDVRAYWLELARRVRTLLGDRDRVPSSSSSRV